MSTRAEQFVEHLAECEQCTRMFLCRVGTKHYELLPPYTRDQLWERFAEDTAECYSALGR